MLGATLHIARGHGEDRFYSPSKTWRGYHQHLQCLWRSRSSDSAGVWSVPPLVFKEKAAVPECLEPGDRTDSEVSPSNAQSVSASSTSSSFLSSPVVSENTRSSNLDRFLESTTPSVPAQFFYKTTMGECRTCDVECRPYFTLAELWDSFKEWSAYGASVPLVLNDSDCVVQYYVPYLSGIQLYCKSSGRFGEKRDFDNSKDFTSDGSSEYNSGKCMKSNGFIQNTSKFSMNGFFLRNNDAAWTDGFSNNGSETGNSDGMLLFEFLEQNAPHSREPLTNKISDLSRHFPELMSLRSCDLLPTSWISVAWYPIYRIPTGTTLRDLDACFLTFHSLSTQMKGMRLHERTKRPILEEGKTQDDDNTPRPFITYQQGSDVPKFSLPIFGLASYKLKVSMWTPNGECDNQLSSSLLKAADNWLRLLGVKLPDYQFFASHGARHR